MQTPFEILDVAEDADDAAIKKAYLKKVKECPPERQAEAFQKIRSAFEAIETDKRRRQYRLFHAGTPDLEGLLKRPLKPSPSQRPEADVLVGALAEAALVEWLRKPHDG
jgi:curved DNA-binding protein CbpA